MKFWTPARDLNLYDKDGKLLRRARPRGPTKEQRAHVARAAREVQEEIRRSQSS